jgi:uncharacterized C2H2 Zn-finger protein
MPDTVVIEMCAYLAVHITSDDPWRCVVCDEITRHAEDGIMPHLTEAHGMDKGRLKKDKDGIFLYPAGK